MRQRGPFLQNQAIAGHMVGGEPQGALQVLPPLVHALPRRPVDQIQVQAPQPPLAGGAQKPLQPLQPLQAPPAPQARPHRRLEGLDSQAESVDSPRQQHGKLLLVQGIRIGLATPFAIREEGEMPPYLGQQDFQFTGREGRGGAPPQEDGLQGSAFPCVGLEFPLQAGKIRRLLRHRGMPQGIEGAVVALPPPAKGDVDIEGTVGLKPGERGWGGAGHVHFRFLGGLQAE